MLGWEPLALRKKYEIELELTKKEILNFYSALTRMDRLKKELHQGNTACRIRLR